MSNHEASREQFRLLFENVDVLSQLRDATIVVDNALRVIYCNSAALRLYGHEPDEVLGIPVSELTRSSWSVPEETVAGEGAHRLRTTVHYKRDSSPMSVEISTSKLEQEGRVVGFVSTIREISDRKNRELQRAIAEKKWEELVVQREFVQQFLQHCPIAAWVKDEEGRYIYHNAKDREEGPSLTGSIGMSDEELFPELAERFREQDLAVLRTGKVLQVIERFDFNAVGQEWLTIKFPIDVQGGGRFVAGMAVNLTNEIQLQDALRQHAELLNLANDAIITIELNDAVSYWNAGAERLYGWTAQEALGQNIHNLLQTGFPRKHSEIQQEFSNAGDWQGELIHRTKRGDPVWVVSRWSARREVGGRVTGRLEINRDLTEQKLSDRALRESEFRFRTSVENMVECFGIYSAIRDENGEIVDFRVEYVNKAACVGNRMEAEEQIGKRLLELLPAHVESGLFDDYRRLVETGEPLIRTALFYADDFGGERALKVVDVRAAKFEDGFVVSWRDISDQKKVEENLRHSDVQLNLALFAARMCSWDWDMVAEEEKFAGDVKAIFGRERDEFKSFADLQKVVHPEDLAPVAQEMERASRERSPYLQEFRVIWPDGSVQWIRGQGKFEYDEGGRPVRMIGVNTNVTAQRRAVEQLRASEALAANVRFVNELAHEINNPLTALTNVIFLLSENRSLDESAKQFIGLGMVELGRVTKLSKQMLRSPEVQDIDGSVAEVSNPDWEKEFSADETVAISGMYEVIGSDGIAVENAVFVKGDRFPSNQGAQVRYRLVYEARHVSEDEDFAIEEDETEPPEPEER